MGSKLLKAASALLVGGILAGGTAARAQDDEMGMRHHMRHEMMRHEMHREMRHEMHRHMMHRMMRHEMHREMRGD